MVDHPLKPFATGTKEKVVAAIALAREGLQACLLAEQAEIPCATDKTKLEEQLEQLRAINNTYFSGS